MWEQSKRVLAVAWKPGWLTGPIFEKELRVSSRRGRSYALRFFYIALLTIFVAIVWVGMVEYQGSATVQQSRMASAGKQITTTIVIFQFVALQLLAIIMLSNAISDEVYHRTLGLLMTTSITSLQIIAGKVLSRLLQLVLLAAISLPILAIVRVFGGVSWDYLLASLCVTLTAALLAGLLSLSFSIENRRTYGVIMRAACALATFYFILPGLIAAAWGFLLPRLHLTSDVGSLLSSAPGTLLTHLNPFYGMTALTTQMTAPGSVPPFSWPLHCAIMLILSALVLARAVRVVRKVALRQATGEFLQAGAKAKRGKRQRRAVPVKRVQGPPVVWKELRAPFIQGVDNRNSYIGLTITILALIATYIPSALDGALDEDFAHVMYALLFIFLGVMINILFSATRITAEKESQSWSLLLATPLSDWEILFGKAVSAFRRCLPIWGLLAGHVILFVLIGYIHPIAFLYLAILVAWLTCFVTGIGLYFSSRFARTTSAVVASLGLTIGLWALGPIVIGVLGLATKHEAAFTKYLWTHPAIQTTVIMSGTAGQQNAHAALRSLAFGGGQAVFNAGPGVYGIGQATTILVGIATAYILAGLFLFWRAKCRLRRNVF